MSERRGKGNQGNDDLEYLKALHGIPPDLVPRLPLRGKGSPQPPSRQRSGSGSQRTHEKIIAAGHLVLTGYAHWLANDLRGSGSTQIRKDALRDLGDIHFGRKREQPSREEIREFYRNAEPLLDHETLWFDAAKRQAVADGFARVVKELGYTVWSCAVLRNHAHLVVRRHRDSLEEIWQRFASGAASVLKERFPTISPAHPIWAHRPYVVYAYDPPGIRTRIKYVNDNPPKEGLPRQSHPFVLPYDGWPHRERS
jgi:hypothetical protein